MKKVTDNKSVRFKQVQWEFICGKEKLNTAQEVVNFLMDDYWVKNKILPGINQAQGQLAAIKEDKDRHPIIPYQEAKEPTFQQHMNKIATLLFTDERQDYIKVVEAATNLSEKQKSLLIVNLRHSAG